MKHSVLIALLSLTSILSAADVVHGSIEEVDAVAKTAVVKADDGQTYSVTVVDTAVLYGPDGNKDVWTGLKKGTEVLVRGTRTGVKITGIELYRIGDGGVKVTKATFKGIGKGGKFVVMNTPKGVEETYHFTSKGVEEAAKGTATGAKVVVYSTEKAGKKIAHFFEIQSAS